MSCEIFWSDTVISRRFNHFYPVLVSTPNGETITEIRVVNVESEEDTGDLVEISVERTDQPCVLVKGYDEDLNLKRKGVSPHEHKYWIGLAPNSVKKQVMVGPDGTKEQIRMVQLLDDLDQNESGRLFSSFAIIVARTQAPAARYLYQMNCDITMSNGQVLTQVFKFVAPSPRIYKLHKDALNRALYIFYHNLMSVDQTDDEIISNITNSLNNLWPDMSRTTELAEKVSASNGTQRRVQLNAKKKAPEEDRRRYAKRTFKELGATMGGSSSSSSPPVKRHLTETSATIMGEIEWLDADKGLQYVIVHNVDASGDEWTIDNVETSPVVDGRVIVTKDPPKALMDNPDMYKSMPYRHIINNAIKYATTSGDTLLWYKVEDCDSLDGPVEPTTIKFTLRNSSTGQFTNVTTNSFISHPFMNLEETVVKVLHDYYHGNATNEQLLTPPEAQIDDKDFVRFQKPGELDLGELDDLDAIPPPSNVPQMERQESFFDDDLLLQWSPPSSPVPVPAPAPQQSEDIDLFPLSPLPEPTNDGIVPPPTQAPSTPLFDDNFDIELEPLDFD
jgi:hypothetical protein